MTQTTILQFSASSAFALEQFLDELDERPLADLDEDRRVERDVEVLGIDL